MSRSALSAKHSPHRHGQSTSPTLSQPPTPQLPLITSHSSTIAMNTQPGAELQHATRVPAAQAHQGDARDVVIPVPLVLEAEEGGFVRAPSGRTKRHRNILHEDIPVCLNLIMFIGSICMFDASTALTGNASMSGVLVASATCGVTGMLLAGIAALFIANGMHGIAMRTLLLSCICGGAGAVCIVAGTQSWEVAVITGGCAIASLVVVAWLSRTRADRNADVEAGLPT
ncbi:hypothetical protein PENSPDRAFT_649170 [Peniophora sp. CONT]|nr:hypothetical protein PENSPDRAFT_649170 [Peniophora sp. CONT]